MKDESTEDFRMFLIPCSCGASFAVAEGYDRRGMHIRSFLRCPECGKRHDPLWEETALSAPRMFEHGLELLG